MTYNIQSVELQSMVDDSTTALPAWDLQAGTTGEVTFGEYMRLRVQFNKSTGGNFAVGQRFMFNPAFFVDAPFIAPLQLGSGWAIDIVNYTGAGVFSVYMQFPVPSPLAQITQRNTKLIATRISNTRLQIDFYFYAVQDLFGYLSTVPRNNNQLLLSAATGTPNLDNSPDSTYRRQVSYLEFLIYAADTNFLPIGMGDPYVRNPLAPNNKSCAYDIGGRYIDNNIGATISWGATVLSENALTSLTNDVGAFKFAQFDRKPKPFLSDKTDDNFDTVTVDIDDSILAKDAENVISIVINRKSGFVPTKVVARIWRIDSLPNTQQFVTEYNIRTADIPASDATAYPNPIGGVPVFSTPASWSAPSGATNIEFRINGTELVSDAQYRIWIGLYDSVGGKASTHLSKPMRVATDGRAAVAPLSVAGLIRTFEYQYTGNDVRLSLFQRFNAGINLNASTYTGGATAFLAQLQSVSVQYVEGTRIIARADYNFQDGQSLSNPPISLAIAGTNYFFSVPLRVPFSGSGSPTNTEVRWVVTFRTPNANGTTNTVSLTPLQIIRRKPVAVATFSSIALFDYAEYLLSNLVPVDTLCRGIDKYIVEFRIGAVPPPQYNITALLIYTNQDGSNTVLEENGFTPTYLPLEVADAFSGVPPDFAADNKAYFVLDISLIPSRATNVAIGGVLQQI
jgi:hypothetical protein